MSDKPQTRLRRPCPDCGKQCQGERCRPCAVAHRAAEREGRKTRTRQPCRECGTPCRAHSGLCVTCRDESPNVLLAGRWINQRGVARWMPDREEAA